MRSKYDAPNGWGSTDGAIARYYRIPEWRALCEPNFAVERFLVMGQKSDVLPLPSGSFKRAIERALPDGVHRRSTFGFVRQNRAELHVGS